MSTRTRREAHEELRSLLGAALACISADGVRITQRSLGSTVDHFALEPIRNPTPLQSQPRLSLGILHEYRSKLHLLTGHMALADVVKLLLTDFDVRPRRADWPALLAANREPFGA